MVPLGSRRAAYWYPVGPVCTARTRRDFNSHVFWYRLVYAHEATFRPLNSDAQFHTGTMHDNQGSFVSEGEYDLPGIEGFQIYGEAKPGCKLQACGYPTNGTTLCIFQGDLVRQFANNQNKITCDSEMQNEIDAYISAGKAIFTIKALIKVPLGYTTQFVLTCSDGTNLPLSTDGTCQPYSLENDVRSVCYSKLLDLYSNDNQQIMFLLSCTLM
ncbi:hypothetical protein BHE74_00004580 [Ensete ventricosum]|nr:hypothetical protein BHE74_00004580 [Ensete ventricosum]RZR82774.1 hypothetical protein BHM03_00009258 [Ensete ventricosum]